MAPRTKSPNTTNGDSPLATDPNLVVASSALVQLNDDDTVKAVAAGAQTMSDDAKGKLANLLAPDQKATNDIWRWIVMTFAIVLMLATAALVAAVIVSFWRKIDTAMIQIVLTVFTTTAGILAGFVSGRMSRAT
jgi:magnesium-transporting ATPase (P-type)